MDRSDGPDAVVRALKSADRFVLICHEEPDPDAIGSMLGLHYLLTSLGKESVPISPDPVPGGLMFLAGGEEIAGPDLEWSPDCLPVVLDTEVARTGALAGRLEEARLLVNIDHHPTNPGGGSHNWIMPEAAATSQMVFALYDMMGAPIRAEAATCLFAGISGDTGSFRHNNTSAEVLDVASELVKAGADPAKVSERLYEMRSWNYLQLLGRVLRTLTVDPSRRVAWLDLTREMLDETRAREDEADGFIQYARMIEGVEVALFFRHVEPGRTRVSLRSKGDIDVSALAKELGGGGHVRAAGCTIEMPLAGARRRVLDVVGRALSSAGGSPSHRPSRSGESG